MKAIPYKLQDGSILGQGIVYNLGVLTHFAPPGLFLDLGLLAHFCSKNQIKKIVKIHKDFEL